MLQRAKSQRRVDELSDIIFDWISEADDVDIRDLIAMLEMVKVQIMFDKLNEIKRIEENGTQENEY